jgi:hypothetical protein
VIVRSEELRWEGSNLTLRGQKVTACQRYQKAQGTFKLFRRRELQHPNIFGIKPANAVSVRFLSAIVIVFALGIYRGARASDPARDTISISQRPYLG